MKNSMYIVKYLSLLMILLFIVSCTQKRSSSAFDVDQYSQVPEGEIAKYSFEMQFSPKTYNAPNVNAVKYSYDGVEFFEAENLEKSLVGDRDILMKQMFSFDAEIPVNFIKVDLLFSNIGTGFSLSSETSDYIQVKENEDEIFKEFPIRALITPEFEDRVMTLNIDIRNKTVHYSGLTCIDFKVGCNDAPIPYVGPTLDSRILDLISNDFIDLSF